ncbi:MAG: transporter substrate-binding domain-containing protein [Eubacteriales bacterium]|nr:transporter substrate-binding domain-containing protein [Eubacteriales bacterium]
MTVLHKKSIWLFIIIWLTIIGIFPACAQEGEVVRVAVNDYANYLQKLPDGSINGYAYEYLMDLQKYTGWKYEFVEMSFTDATQALIDGDIDLLPGVQFLEERTQLWDYSKRDMGDGSTVLCVTPNDNRYSFNDFPAYNGMRIGALTSTARVEQTQQKLAQYGVTAKYFLYDNDWECKQALAQGKVDALLMSSVRCDSSCKIIARLQTTPLYFCINQKRPELKQQLDDAMEELHLIDPAYEEQLDQKYYGDIIVQVSLSLAEKEYAKACGPITVAAYTDLKPLEYLDEDSKLFKGITPDTFSLLGSYSGLSFRFVPRNDELLAEQIANGQVQLVSLMENQLQSAQAMGYTLSKSYYNGSFSAVANLRLSNYLSQDCHVVLKTGMPVLERIAAKYGYTHLQYADTYEGCVDLVNSGKADLTILSTTTASRVANHAYLKNIQLYVLPNSEMTLSIGIPMDADPMLTSILNKAITSVSDDLRSDILLNQIALNQDPSDFRDFWAQNQELILLLLLFILLLLVLAAVYIAVTRTKLNRKLKLEAQKATAAGRAKMDFLSRMSHEIRTPMNAIIGMANLGLDDIRNPEAVKRELQQISESGQYLLGLINDILDVSRIESNKFELHPEWVVLADIIQPVVRMIEPLAQAADVQFIHPCIAPSSPSTKVEAYVDKMRFQQLLINLLNNACKFTPQGGTVSWSIKHLGETNKESRDLIIIEDNGCGMSEGFLKRIGEPFVQEASGTNGKLGGAGLGLYIVKKICDAMHFHLEITSQPGKGTAFRLTAVYPYRIPSEPSAPPKEEPLRLDGLPILVVEDNELNRMIAQEMLKRAGAIVDAAEDGIAALARFTASPQGYYAAIIMDIQMPRMNGLDCTRAIRALERPDGKTVPIVAMSANAFDEDVQASLAAGMNAHLSKPITMKLLLDGLRPWLSKTEP